MPREAPTFKSQRPTTPEGDANPHYGGSPNCRPNAEAMAGQTTSRVGQKVAINSLGGPAAPSVTGNAANLNEALSYIQSELRSGRRVVIGVHRVGSTATPNSSPASGGDYATQHFVTVYDMRVESGITTLSFRDPGTSDPDQSKGTLRLNSQTHMMEGSSPFPSAPDHCERYQMTVVRANPQ